MTIENLLPQHIDSIFNKFIKESAQKKINKEWDKIHFKTYPRYEKILFQKLYKSGEIEKLLKSRRSSRTFNKKNISISDIEQVIYYSAGIMRGSGDNSRRAYPSGGARYPLEIYLISIKTEFGKGIYHYNVEDNCFEKFPYKFENKNMKNLFTNQSLSKSKLIVLITSVIGRSQIKYEFKSLKLALIESGHLCQNILLMSTKLKINACPIAGYNANLIHKILNIDGFSESMIYAIALG